MDEKEKDFIEKIAEAVPSMSEREKGYFLGYAEALASKKDGFAEKTGEKEVV